MRHIKQHRHPEHSAASRLRFRIEPWQRRMIYLCVTALVASGSVWLVGHFLLHGATEFGEASNPWAPWTMKVHGAVAMVTLFFVGSLLNGHMRRAHAQRRNHWSGWSMVAFWGWLTVSGYALYYIAGEQSRSLWSTSHWVPGLLLPLLILVHIVLGRRRARTAP